MKTVWWVVVLLVARSLLGGHHGDEHRDEHGGETQYRERYNDRSQGGQSRDRDRGYGRRDTRERRDSREKTDSRDRRDRRDGRDRGSERSRESEGYRGGTQGRFGGREFVRLRENIIDRVRSRSREKVERGGH